MIYDPYPFKRCCKCSNEYLPTKAFFNWSKARGLRQPCRACIRDKNRRYQKSHPEVNREGMRRYVAKHKETILVRARKYRETYPEKVKVAQKKYEQNHPDKIRAKRIKKAQRDKQERLINPEKYRTIERARYITNPTLKKEANHRRRARKRNLPTGFSAKDWLRCLEYWHYCCAYCGQQQGIFKSMQITIDHWIPIADNGIDNPGDTAENILPACFSCNSSKRHSNPIEWINNHFSKRKARPILKRISVYFEWVRQQNK